MPFDSRAVANEFLKLANQQGQTLTPMKLVKLVYIAHGWHLGFYSKPLLNEEVEAWKYGPVVPQVYKEFRGYGNAPIRFLAVRPSEDLTPVPIDFPNTDPNEVELAKKLILDVWSAYGHMSAVQLSALTHQRGTPWSKVTSDGSDVGANKKIATEEIKHYYDELREKGPGGA